MQVRFLPGLFAGQTVSSISILGRTGSWVQFGSNPKAPKPLWLASQGGFFGGGRDEALAGEVSKPPSKLFAHRGQAFGVGDVVEDAMVGDVKRSRRRRLYDGYDVAAHGASPSF